MICPCKDCKDRGCGAKHETCEQYAKWKAEDAAVKKWLNDRITLPVSEAVIRKRWQNKRLQRRKYTVNK